MHFVPNAAIQGIEAVIAQHDGDVDDIMHSAGFDPAWLSEPAQKIPGQVFVDLLELAARRLNLRYLGLELAQLQGASVLGALWMLMRNATTVGEGLELLVKNYPYHSDVSLFTLEPSPPDNTLLGYAANAYISGEITQLLELGLGIVCLTLRRYMAPDWRPKAVYFSTPEPYDKRALYPVFGDNIYFDQGTSGILLTASELAVPLRHASFVQRHHFQQEVLQQQAFNPRSAVLRTEYTINANLVRHRCTLGFVARCLGMNPRTLQYQLQQQGTSYQELYRKARLSLALRYLQQSDLPITSIAERLQFGEASVFSRFIKQQTGQSPRQLRQAAKPG